jgi:hypothetical protein
MKTPVYRHLIEQYTWIEAIMAPEADILNKLNSRCETQLHSLEDILSKSLKRQALEYSMHMLHHKDQSQQEL